tara:strand:- start:1581 stop:1733 length:153 start_codon:yes stop_codon:yes gene_type:complete
MELAVFLGIVKTGLVKGAKNRFRVLSHCFLKAGNAFFGVTRGHANKIDVV